MIWKNYKISWIAMLTLMLEVGCCRAEWVVFKYKIVNNTRLADGIVAELNPKNYTYKTDTGCLAECNQEENCSAAFTERDKSGNGYLCTLVTSCFSLDLKSFTTTASNGTDLFVKITKSTDGGYTDIPYDSCEQGKKCSYFEDRFTCKSQIVQPGCPNGYKLTPGDIPGSAGQIRSISNKDIDECAKLCNDTAYIAYSCCSFEWSPTERNCNLNKDCDPSGDKWKDYLFCQQNNP